MSSATTPVLQVDGITQRLGSLAALNKLGARFDAGRVSAIIGPNGAGKSTFFHVVGGAFPPSEGRLMFQGRDIPGLPQHEFARIGIAKSFQITNLERLSAQENVRVAVQKRRSRPSPSCCSWMNPRPACRPERPSWPMPRSRSAPARCSGSGGVWWGLVGV